MHNQGEAHILPILLTHAFAWEPGIYAGLVWEPSLREHLTDAEGESLALERSTRASATPDVSAEGRAER